MVTYTSVRVAVGVDSVLKSSFRSCTFTAGRVASDAAWATTVELGCATMVTIKMAVESYRQRKTMLWDAKKERVVAT